MTDQTGYASPPCLALRTPSLPPFYTYSGVCRYTPNGTSPYFAGNTPVFTEIDLSGDPTTAANTIIAQ